MKRSWIRKNDGIRADIGDLLYRLFKNFDILISWEDIHRQQCFASLCMQIIDSFFEIIKIVNFILSHSQWGKRYTNIDFFCSIMARHHSFFIRSSWCNYCRYMGRFHSQTKRNKYYSRSSTSLSTVLIWYIRDRKRILKIKNAIPVITQKTILTNPYKSKNISTITEVLNHGLA